MCAGLEEPSLGNTATVRAPAEEVARHARDFVQDAAVDEPNGIEHASMLSKHYFVTSTVVRVVIRSRGYRSYTSALIPDAFYWREAGWFCVRPSTRRITRAAERIYINLLEETYSLRTFVQATTSVHSELEKEAQVASTFSKLVLRCRRPMSVPYKILTTARLVDFAAT